jgi:hypothetical protein
MSAPHPTRTGSGAAPPDRSAERAARGHAGEWPSPGAGGTGELAWRALALRVAAERRKLEDGAAVDLAGMLDALRSLLAGGPAEAGVAPAGLALRDELERLADALERAVETTGRELVELERQRRALGAYAARAEGRRG